MVYTIFWKRMAGVIALALVLVVASSHASVSAHASRVQRTQLAPAERESVSETNVTGHYTGRVTLTGYFGGVYSDTFDPVPMSLGSIDLALDLESSGPEITGHVELSKTMVFVTGSDEGLGPQVSGVLNGTTLHLESEKVAHDALVGRTLEEDGRVVPQRRATRQFRLVSTEIEDSGTIIKGEYRETVWDLLPEPVTLVGAFTLRKPAFSASTGATSLMATFSADPIFGQPPLAVAFTDRSIGNPVSWFWEFGDGVTSTERNPVHTYTEPGSYTVKLTTRNGSGSDTMTKVNHIQVVELHHNLYMPMIHNSVRPNQ